MRYRHCFLLLFLLMFFTACLSHNTTSWKGWEQGNPVSKQPERNPLRLLLEHLRISDRDLAIDAEQDDRDCYLLARTRLFLGNPFSITSYADHLSRHLGGRKFSLHDMLAAAVEEVEIDVSGTPIPPALTVPPEQSERILSGIAPEARAVIVELLSVIIASRQKMNEAFSPLPSGDLYFLKNYFTEMMLLDKQRPVPGRPGRPAPTSQGPLKREQHYAKEMAFFLPGAIRSADFYSAAVALAAAADRLMQRSDVLQSLSGTGNRINDGSVRGDIIAREETPWGTIIIGGNGPNYYSGINPLLIIDLGGDDEYHNLASPPGFGPFNAPISIILDLKGNDLHRSSGKYAQGSGAFGCSFLIDCSGDDTYLSGDFSQGCGFFGVGILYDLNGNDRYRSDTMAQGAGAFGIGILCDTGGNDSYSGSLYNQGLGFTGGMGLLMDARGDDTFFSGGTYPDHREPEGAYVSFSQGCGLGDRNYASGGLGVLWNGSGDDHYSGSYFAQGTGYWLGTGLLIDGAGNDSYQSRRYSQGAATHRAVGALVDRSGDDDYFSWGASQGCGYDFSQGLLTDLSGNDSYHATWFVQGVGGKSGVGVLIDQRGHDSYQSGSFCSQGNAQYWREEVTGGIGLLVDLQGDDQYSGAGKDNHLWREAFYGGGIDTSAPPPGNYLNPWHEIKPPPPGQQSAGPVNPLLTELGEPLSELEGDLDDEHQRLDAVERLSAMGTGIIPRLIEYLVIRDVQLTVTVREIIVKMGKSAAPALRKELNKHAQQTRVTAHLLTILGDLEDRDALESFVPFLHADEALVREAAMRGVSKIKDVATPAVTLPSVDDRSPAVRKFCAAALSAGSDSAAFRALTKLLADEHYSVRLAAFNSLREQGKAAGPYLRELLEQHHNHQGYARELAGDMLAGRTGRDRQPVRGATDTPSQNY